MSRTLIVKLNATGDVVRTTTLLHHVPGPVTWITARANLPLLEGIRPDMRCLSWDDREAAADGAYDLAINLEDDLESARLTQRLRPARIFGAVLGDGELSYSDDAREWFDMSLISRFGRQQADALKLRNRRSYQQMILSGLGLEFQAEPYLLPRAAATGLQGDVALAPAAGPVWPMKNWAHYDELRRQLESEGLRVNVLPRRDTLLEHLGDIAGHRCLVSGDSLPMHLALALRLPCVTLFTCTSPWEIHDYGVQTKIVSPLLEKFFYKRGMDTRATTAISLQEVHAAVRRRLAAPAEAV
jgi:heptosyltransferase II